MKILEHRALRGPNRYSRYPAIFMLLDIGTFEERPSDTIEGFTDRLINLVPTLQSHGCSIGGDGGFITRLRRGTWMGHIAEHIAIEMQCLAGIDVGYGKTFSTSHHGIYKVVYRYRVESAGLLAGQEAVALVQAVAENRDFDIHAVIARLNTLREHDFLGPSTNSIVEEAKSRGIPTQRLNNISLVQLGYGSKQRHIQATMTDRTSALSVEIADEKFRTKELLKRAGIPTSEGSIAETLEDALKIAKTIGYPVAVKPEVGNHGRGITARVSDQKELETAFTSALRIHDSVIVEQSLSGHDFRVLVIDGNMVAAALRDPACVIGDGKSSIEALIKRINEDPRRGNGHEKMLTAITIDHMTERLLSFSGYTLDDILPPKRSYILNLQPISAQAVQRVM